MSLTSNNAVTQPGKTAKGTWDWEGGCGCVLWWTLLQTKDAAPELGHNFCASVKQGVVCPAHLLLATWSTQLTDILTLSVYSCNLLVGCQHEYLKYVTLHLLLFSCLSVCSFSVCAVPNTWCYAAASRLCSRRLCSSENTKKEKEL